MIAREFEEIRNCLAQGLEGLHTHRVLWDFERGVQRIRIGQDIGTCRFEWYIGSEPP